MYAALVLGTADYVRKNGFRSVLLALSGGIDSALVATIAADAVGPENVHVILMPSKWSSDHSVTDAEDLVERQGINARTIAIQSIVDAFRDGLGDFPVSGLPAENLQSRVRGVINMAVSNNEGHLVLTTGNKSEIATGYSTLYGDSAGGFGPIKDVLKTLVWDAGAVAERGGRAAGPDSADTGQLDRQAAVGGAGPRSARHRLAAGLRGARRAARRLRGKGHGLGRADRGGPRPGPRRSG